MAETQYVFTQTKQGKKEWIPLPTGGVAAHDQAWSTITDTPTTLAGYGITDGGSMEWPGAGIPLSTGASPWGTSYTTTGSGTVVALAASPTLSGTPVVSGNLEFSNDATERFIKSSVNGGAIRLRGNSVSTIDRGVKIGQVDNSGNWINTWVEIPADSGDVIFSGTPVFDNDATFASDLLFSDDETERFIKSTVAGGAIRIRGNASAITDRGLKLGFVDNGGTFYDYITIVEGIGAAGVVSINGGLHIGGDSDAGDNNLLVDGSGTVIGVLLCSTEIRCTGDIIAAYS